MAPVPVPVATSCSCAALCLCLGQVRAPANTRTQQWPQAVTSYLLVSSAKPSNVHPNSNHILTFDVAVEPPMAFEWSLCMSPTPSQVLGARVDINSDPFFCQTFSAICLFQYIHRGLEACCCPGLLGYPPPSMPPSGPYNGYLVSMNMSVQAPSGTPPTAPPISVSLAVG